MKRTALFLLLAVILSGCERESFRSVGSLSFSNEIVPLPARQEGDEPPVLERSDGSFVRQKLVMPGAEKQPEPELVTYYGISN